MSKIKAGDVVYDPLLPEEKGIALGYTDNGRNVDILMRHASGYFMLCSYPESDIKTTGEHVDISTLTDWYK